MHEKFHSAGWNYSEIRDFNAYARTTLSYISTPSRICICTILLLSFTGVTLNFVGARRLYVDRQILSAINVRYLIAICFFGILQLTCSFILFGNQTGVIFALYLQTFSNNSNSSENSQIFRVFAVSNIPAPLFWILYRLASLGEVWVITIYTFYRYQAICRPLDSIINSLKAEYLFKWIIFGIIAIGFFLSISRELPFLGWTRHPYGNTITV